MTGVEKCYFFFFKQKTAYEMRISDWSSDVCSSDLSERGSARHDLRVEAGLLHHLAEDGLDGILVRLDVTAGRQPDAKAMPVERGAPRSEARRVGKECVSTCRSRWSPYN